MKKLYNKPVQTDLQTLRTSIICTVVYFSLLAKGLTKSGLTEAPRDRRAGWYHPFKYRASTNYNQNRVLHKDQQDILNYCREEKKNIETLWGQSVPELLRQSWRIWFLLRTGSLYKNTLHLIQYLLSCWTFQFEIFVKSLTYRKFAICSVVLLND